MHTIFNISMKSKTCVIKITSFFCNKTISLPYYYDSPSSQYISCLRH